MSSRGAVIDDVHLAIARLTNYRNKTGHLDVGTGASSLAEPVCDLRVPPRTPIGAQSMSKTHPASRRTERADQWHAHSGCGELKTLLQPKQLHLDGWRGSDSNPTGVQAFGARNHQLLRLYATLNACCKFGAWHHGRLIPRTAGTKPEHEGGADGWWFAPPTSRDIFTLRQRSIPCQGVDVGTVLWSRATSPLYSEPSAHSQDVGQPAGLLKLIKIHEVRLHGSVQTHHSLSRAHHIQCVQCRSLS